MIKTYQEDVEMKDADSSSQYSKLMSSEGQKISERIIGSNIFLRSPTELYRQ